MLRRRLPLIVATALIAAASTAGAHGVEVPPAAQTPLSIDGTLAGAGTTYGLVLQQNGDWRWTPEETLEADRIHDWRLVDGGERVLAATSRGLLSTTNGGCTWGSASPLIGSRTVTDLAAGPEGLLASTESGGRTNGVYQSTDGGESWSLTDLSGAHLLLQRVVASGEAAWAAGYDRGARRHRVWWSDDGGQTWQPAGGDLADWSDIRLLGAADGGVLLGHRRGEQWVVSRTDRRLAAPRQLARLAAEPARALPAASATDDIYLRRVDGESLRVSDGKTAQVLDRTECLAPIDDHPMACRSVVASDHHLAPLLQASDRPPKIPFRAVRPRDCPEETAGAQLIPRIWPTLRQQGVGPTPSSPAPPDRGCGCRATSRPRPTPALLLLIPLLLSRRYRS